MDNINNIIKSLNNKLNVIKSKSNITKQDINIVSNKIKLLRNILKDYEKENRIVTIQISNSYGKTLCSVNMSPKKQ